MTRYNTKSQKKTMQKRIGSKKLRKVGNGNVFQNLIQIVVNIFEKKSYILFFTQLTQKSCLIWISFLTKKGGQDSN